MTLSGRAARIGAISLETVSADARALLSLVIYCVVQESSKRLKSADGTVIAAMHARLINRISAVLSQDGT